MTMPIEITEPGIYEMSALGESSCTDDQSHHDTQDRHVVGAPSPATPTITETTNSSRRTGHHRAPKPPPSVAQPSKATSLGPPPTRPGRPPNEQHT